jgi:hypothetical protein
MRKTATRGRVGRNDWHSQAAEFHDLAAHAHRSASAHDQTDRPTAHEYSKQAMEYAIKAYRLSQEAHRQSGKTTSASSAKGSKPAIAKGKK